MEGADRAWAGRVGREDGEGVEEELWMDVK